MFRSARLKLTAWYLVIIVLITVAFSLTIYLGVTNDLRRRFEGLENRMNEGGDFRMRQRMHRLMHGDLQASQGRVLMILLFANGMILIVSSAAGYFLAGKTLEPIEKALEEQKRFISDASHELRTPLTALRTSVEVALRDKKITKAEAIEALQSSLEDIGSLQLLASNLLDLAQYQKANGTITLAAVNLADVAAGVSSKVRPLAKEKNIDLTINTNDALVQGDQALLEKVMVILLDNAVKYTPKGGQVTLAVKGDGKNAHITVKDTGIGIAREELNHIFDRFYRADQSRSKSKIAGFGLGLSIAKRIVDSHHGSIEASSVIGSGTTFTVRLPLRHS